MENSTKVFPLFLFMNERKNIRDHRPDKSKNLKWNQKSFSYQKFYSFAMTTVKALYKISQRSPDKCKNLKLNS
jgi:hypothetical protein